MCVVADIQDLPLGGGDLPEFGRLLNQAGLRDEADRLGFAGRLDDSPQEELADVGRELLQRQAWAFQAIDNGHAGNAIEQFIAAQTIWPDDWPTNSARAWVVVNTGSRKLLTDALSAGQTAVDTTVRWRAASGELARKSQIPAPVSSARRSGGRALR